MDEQKLEDLRTRLAEQVAAITSGEDWRRWLKQGTKFHGYSFRNVVLIAMQAPDATRVAGYRKWQELGRQVRKGERGIVILAPLTRKTAAEGDVEAVSRVVGFTGASVFDLAQTDGEPLAEPPQPELIEGEAPDGMQAGLVSQIEAAGFAYDEGPLEDGMKGVTRYGPRTVTIDDALTNAEKAMVTAHELAHVLLHDPTQFDRAGHCRGRGEVEAESVAFIVSTARGLDTAKSSFAYVAGWIAGVPGQDTEKVLESTGAVVMRTAKRILAPFEEEAS